MKLTSLRWLKFSFFSTKINFEVRQTFSNLDPVCLFHHLFFVAASIVQTQTPVGYLGSFQWFPPVRPTVERPGSFPQPCDIFFASPGQVFHLGPLQPGLQLEVPLQSRLQLEILRQQLPQSFHLLFQPWASLVIWRESLLYLSFVKSLGWPEVLQRESVEIVTFTVWSFHYLWAAPGVLAVRRGSETKVFQRVAPPVLLISLCRTKNKKRGKQKKQLNCHLVAQPQSRSCCLFVVLVS